MQGHSGRAPTLGARPPTVPTAFPERDGNYLRALLKATLLELVAPASWNWDERAIFSVVRLLDWLDLEWRTELRNTAARLRRAGLRWHRTDELIGEQPSPESDKDDASGAPT